MRRKFPARKDNHPTIVQWLMGQIARATKSKADPNVAKELLVKALEEKRK